MDHEREGVHLDLTKLETTFQERARFHITIKNTEIIIGFLLWSGKFYLYHPYRDFSYAVPHFHDLIDFIRYAESLKE